MIPYGRQFLDDVDVEAVSAVLRGDWLTCGPMVDEFESQLAGYCGAKHVIAVSNGTAALHLAMLAADIGKGDRVVTSPNTFLSSATCAEFAGAQAMFSDIDAGSLNLDVKALEKSWHEDIKAVVAVDFAGQPCNMPAISDLAKRHDAFVVEDASHAIGSRFSYQGSEYRVGGHPWADMTTFSFHPVKTMTCGEGGAIATDDDELAEKCRRFRNHGMQKLRPDEPWRYEIFQPGFNYRITDIQCALGISQLSRLEDFISRRQAIADRYNDAFSEIPWITSHAAVSSGDFVPSRIAWHLYVVEIDFSDISKARAHLMDELRRKGVGTQVHYIPVHTQPYFKQRYGYALGDCPVAEAYYEKCLTLPLYPAMKDSEIQQVISALIEAGE
jgi:UDP-4-amino-4,6-dideoxy-N-acetyl-beta-L-altrosamine transaminase